MVLVRALSESSGRSGDGEGVADLSPFSGPPSTAQLVAQAIAGSPPTLLQQQYQSRIGIALADLAREAGALAAAANTLSPLNGLNAFQQPGVNSARPEVIDGFALAGARPAVFHVVVDRLAAAQENAGFLLTRGARTRIGAGSHRLVVRSWMGRSTVTVQIDPEDTNEIALGEVVRALNSASPSVSAALAYPTPSTAQATVASRSSGRLGAFNIEDMPGEGSIASTSGIREVVQPAQDASFAVNGIPTTAPENAVYLQGGAVQLQLKRASEGQPVTLTVGPNQDAVTRAVTMLTGAVSSMAATIGQAGDTLAPSFVQEFAAAIQSLSAAAARVGIAVHQDNTMTLEEATLRQLLAGEPAAAQDSISGPNGLAHRLGYFANEVIGSPLSRFGAANLIPQLPPASSHPTPTQLLASNTLSSLLYAQLLSQGLFVNSPS
ncbi:MAG: hypothetical protein KGJ86_02015 [Chloroflexota bacterium]|nr:hypothetical protein [Chloroflexota bacterium]